VITEKHVQLLLSANESGRPLSVTTFGYLPAAQQYIDEVLRAFLGQLGLEMLFDQLSFCLRELAVNAKKANTKRLYFEHKGLDISSAADYRRGMESFKLETLNSQRQYLDLLRDHQMYVKVEFHKWRQSCSLAVRNNTRILESELSRVHDKIDKAHRYHSLEDAFSEVLDESEGAGLGILVLVLMLKKVGFSGEFFRVYTLGDETVARIILPLTVD
jgi:hypothetical protein